MSDRDDVLARLEAAMVQVENAANLNLNKTGAAAPSQDDSVVEELALVTAERDQLAAELKELKGRNAELGGRLDAAITKLDTVLKQG